MFAVILNGMLETTINGFFGNGYLTKSGWARRGFGGVAFFFRKSEKGLGSASIASSFLLFLIRKSVMTPLPGPISSTKSVAVKLTCEINSLTTTLFLMKFCEWKIIEMK